MVNSKLQANYPLFYEVAAELLLDSGYSSLEDIDIIAFLEDAGYTDEDLELAELHLMSVIDVIDWLWDSIEAECTDNEVFTLLNSLTN